MDLMQMLDRIEKNFFNRLDKKISYEVGRDRIKKEFNDAVKEVLVLTYSKVMKEAGDKPEIEQ